MNSKKDSTPSFSVLTVTKRLGWEKVASESIARQTIKPKQWIVVYEEKPFNFEYAKPILVRAPEKRRVSNLNASLNHGLRFIDTDYVIFYQDFIRLNDDCFEKLLDLAGSKTFVTTCTPNRDGTDDIRYLGVDSPRPCLPEEWEANVALAPMEIIRKLGGFDERLDDGWSWDNALLARKASIVGCNFILDETNRPKLFKHETKDHDTLPKNGELVETIIGNILSGKESINAGHLERW